MLKFNNFLKTALVAGLMVTMAPDAKPMLKPAKFDEKELSRLVLAQDYDAATVYAAKHLAGAQNDVVFDAIQRLRFEHCDQFCLYMDIFNFADRKRKEVYVGSGEIAYALKSMVFQMLLLPGEIACCLARGDEPAALMNLFAEFQLVYNHWFTKYFCQDKELFDKQPLYKYVTVLAGAIGDTVLDDEAVTEVEEVDEDDGKEATSFKAQWDRRRLAPPFPVWARYCKKLPHGFVESVYKMGFGTPKPQERTACETIETVRLDARIRKECWIEACKAARACETWEAFWTLKLKDLIPNQLGKLVKGFKKDEGTVESVARGMASLSVDERKAPAKRGSASSVSESGPAPARPGAKTAEPKPKEPVATPVRTDGDASGDGSKDGKAPAKAIPDNKDAASVGGGGHGDAGSGDGGSVVGSPGDTVVDTGAKA